MPYTKPKRKPDLTAAQWAEYDHLRAEGLSLTKAAAAMHLSQATLSRRVDARARVNGNLPAIRPSQPIAMASQPIAVAVDDLQSRVATLEAFMAAVQAEHRSVSQPVATASQAIAAHRREPPTWVSRGLQVAADMVEAIDHYAAQHRLDKRDIVDAALRQFFAEAGEAVGDA